MKKALLFRADGLVLVSAEEVKQGVYSRNNEFVDPEYEFKVRFVKGARNNGGPYFRLYYSYNEYKTLFPERSSRYEIVANMRRYRESVWHNEWKKNVSDFCLIEKCIKNDKTGKRRFADAFCEKFQTCIEFQHSYIAFDFEERNNFYNELSLKTIWLYDLTYANVRQDDVGDIEILENNARGFFRISENPENLKKHLVYIQVKTGMIYRVKELCRRESSTKHKSTIRYFAPTEAYTEEEFICNLKSNTLGDKDDGRNELKTIVDLWDKNYKWMIVENTVKSQNYFIWRNQNDQPFRDSQWDCIQFKYADERYSKENISVAPLIKKKPYSIGNDDEKSPIWRLIKAERKA